MYSEDDLLPLSGLQHLVFCERQWGLIHIEETWAENRLTVEGTQLHERADRVETESRGDLRIARGVAIRSLRLGLSGRADVVEFHRVEGAAEDALCQLNQDARGGAPAAVALPGVRGLWRPIPVEYKRGKPKKDRSDEAQLCAQALCLEEMLGVAIPEGALYYGRTHRRVLVAIDEDLRAFVESLAARMHALWAAGDTPLASYEPKCDNCSLIDQCQPKLWGGRRRASDYLRNAIDQAKKDDPQP